MDIQRIKQLVELVKVDQVVSESGVSRRTLYRFKSGGNFSFDTINKLADWAKGRKLKGKV